MHTLFKCRRQTQRERVSIASADHRHAGGHPRTVRIICSTLVIGSVSQSHKSLAVEMRSQRHMDLAVVRLGILDSGRYTKGCPRRMAEIVVSHLGLVRAVWGDET